MVNRRLASSNGVSLTYFSSPPSLFSFVRWISLSKALLLASLDSPVLSALYSVCTEFACLLELRFFEKKRRCGALLLGTGCVWRDDTSVSE